MREGVRFRPNPGERNEGEFIPARENLAPEGRPTLAQRFIAGKALIPRLGADTRHVIVECEQPRRVTSEWPNDWPGGRPILGL